MCAFAFVLSHHLLSHHLSSHERVGLFLQYVVQQFFSQLFARHSGLLAARRSTTRVTSSLLSRHEPLPLAEAVAADGAVNIYASVLCSRRCLQELVLQLLG